jgi:catechol 2,3-dioxygenase
MPHTIHPATRIGAVHLVVADLDRSVSFYQEAIGLDVHRREGGMAALGVGERDLLVLLERPGARSVRGRTGLYHFALLLPTRHDLAHALKRLADTRTPLQGFADHLVSEAIYLADPDGNGIEIYRDRPREDWTWTGGEIRMATEPLDVEDLLREIAGEGVVPERMPPGTVVGHIHLHVASIPQARTFYCDVLGFEAVATYGPAALFVSAGGYHHHIGLNTWAGEGAPPPPPDAAGLRYFEVVLPDREALDDVLDRVRATWKIDDSHPDGVLLRDPAQNAVLLRADA